MSTQALWRALALQVWVWWLLARDSSGNVIVSSWDFIGRCKSAEEAKLRACIVSLYIGIMLHNPIILETDCVFVAASLAKESFDRSALFDLKKEAMSISKMLHMVKISKINRSANVVAHLIAKYSFDNRSDGILVNDFPACVVNFVMSDCNNSVG